MITGAAFKGAASIAIGALGKSLLGYIGLTIWGLGLVATVIGCFTYNSQGLFSQMLPGEDSDLTHFTFFSNDVSGDLKSSWSLMRDAKELARNPCSWDLSLQGSVGEKLSTLVSLGIKSNIGDIEGKVRDATNEAHSAVLGAINQISADLSDLDALGADNENYSGGAFAYYENGTNISLELASLEPFLRGAQVPATLNVTSSAARQFLEIIEKTKPAQPQVNTSGYLILPAQQAIMQEDATLSESRQYSVFIYNSLVGRPHALIDELYALHAELNTAIEMMQAEQASLKYSYGEAMKNAKDAFAELEKQKVSRADEALVSTVSLFAAKYGDATLSLSSQTGTASLAADFEAARQIFRDAEAVQRRAGNTESAKGEDYLHYSIEQMKAANLLASQAEARAKDLSSRLSYLRDAGRRAFEKMKEERRSDFLSEAYADAKKKGDNLEDLPAGDAIQKYAQAMQLLQSCGPVQAGGASLDSYEMLYDKLEKILKELEKNVDVSAERALLKAIKNEKDYTNPAEMVNKLNRLWDQLLLKAEPLEKRIEILRNKASGVLATAQDFEDALGTHFDGFNEYQSGFSLSLSRDPLSNAGTLFDLYSKIIANVGAKLEAETQSFLEKQARTIRLFPAVPACNEKQPATLLVKIRNPTSLALAKEGLVLHIAPAFSDDVYVRVVNLGPGEEALSEHEVLAEPGTCKATRESVEANENSATWFVNLEVTAHTEKLSLDVGGSSLTLSGDKEGWHRAESRRVSTPSPLIVSRSHAIQKTSDNRDQHVIVLVAENTLPEELQRVSLTDYVGVDVQKLSCDPHCAAYGSSITFQLNKMDSFQKATFTATYFVDNASFEVNYTLGYLAYLVGELKNKSPGFAISPQHEQYLMIREAGALGQQDLVLTDGKKLITELKKLLSDAGKNESKKEPKNETLDSETIKRIEKAFTDLNNKISKLCKITSCASLQASYDEAYLKWKQRSAFDADAVIRDVEKKTADALQQFKIPAPDSYQQLMEKFRKAVSLEPSLNLSNALFSFSDYQNALDDWNNLLKISDIAGSMASDESKLSQLTAMPSEKLAQFGSEVKSFGNRVNKSISALMAAAKDEITRAKTDSQKAGAYAEDLAKAEDAYAIGEYNNAIAYAQLVPSVFTEPQSLPLYLLLIPFVGVAGAFAYVLRRPKKNFKPKTFKEVFYDNE